MRARLLLPAVPTLRHRVHEVEELALGHVAEHGPQALHELGGERVDRVGVGGVGRGLVPCTGVGHAPAQSEHGASGPRRR